MWGKERLVLITDSNYLLLACGTERRAFVIDGAKPETTDMLSVHRSDLDTEYPRSIRSMILFFRNALVRRSGSDR